MLTRFELFEREANAGGVVKNIIPQFRIPAELIQHDIDFVADHGVKFEYGCSPDLTIEQLKNQGFHYVLIATGTDKNSGVKLAGDNQNVWKSLPFLREYNKGTALKLGKHVVVVGAGNTAMDCARAALRVPGVEKATVVYRTRAPRSSWANMWSLSGRVTPQWTALVRRYAFQA